MRTQAVPVLKQYVRSVLYLYNRHNRFATIASKEQVLSTRRAQSDLHNRRRLDFVNPHKVNINQQFPENSYSASLY